MTDQIKKEFEEALNAYCEECWAGAATAPHAHARILALFEAQAKPRRGPVAWGNFKLDGTLVGLSEERHPNWMHPKPLYIDPKPEGWIAVTERLPELNQECLVCWGDGEGEVQSIAVAALRPTWPDGIPMWYGHGGSHNSVTHWMPQIALPIDADSPTRQESDE